jgi:hypothetical protein
MSMTGYGEHRVVTFNILRAYRGNANGNVTVLTGLGGAIAALILKLAKNIWSMPAG